MPFGVTTMAAGVLPHVDRRHGGIVEVADVKRLVVGGDGSGVREPADRDGRPGGVGRHPDRGDGVVSRIYGVDGPAIRCDHHAGWLVANRNVGEWAIGRDADRRQRAGVANVDGPTVGCHDHGEGLVAHRNRREGRVGGRADRDHRFEADDGNIDGLPIGHHRDRLPSFRQHDG